MTLMSALFIIAVMLLLVIGLYSMLVTRNLMRILVSVELLTKAVTLLMIGVGYTTGHINQAQSYVITIIVVEVMILVVATGMMFGIYNNTGSLNTRDISKLNG